MDPSQFSQASNFVDLLNSQQKTFLPFPEDSVQLSSSELPEASNNVENTPAERRERRLWTPVEDIVLISAWLNTSKDPVVGNEQPSRTFWKRIAAYFAASPKVAGCEERLSGNCKQRWQKINDQVNKFCGSYEAATREKSSGQNENDILKRAHEIFFNNYNKNFILDHAWKELRNDQKWCELSYSAKKRKCEDGSQSSASNADARPPGVKAAKSKKAKGEVEGKTLTTFQSMWDIKKEDLAIKERLKKMTILDSLITKKESLAEKEEALKMKLINEFMDV